MPRNFHAIKYIFPSTKRGFYSSNVFMVMNLV